MLVFDGDMEVPEESSNPMWSVPKILGIRGR
jgi:hypothetical protein